MRSSSSRKLAFGEKLREYFSLLTIHLLRKRADVEGLISTMMEYNSVLIRYRKLPLNRSRVLEIGFGARPLRFYWLLNNDVDICGVDLDAPLLKPSMRAFLDIWKRNGSERALKSIVRYFLSDRKEFGSLKEALRAIKKLTYNSLPADRTIIADASKDAFWQDVGHFDFIYSEDVFEHIPRENLKKLVQGMANALKPNGLALIRPMIFTGICGGHHVEWYPSTLNQARKRRTEPWEHLRKDRFPANTYLNRITLAEFTALFEQYFEILDIEVEAPDLGRELLTDEIKSELSKYGEDELFSNRVRFVLEPR